MNRLLSFFSARRVGTVALLAMGVALVLPLSASAQSSDYYRSSHHGRTVCRNVRVEDTPRDQHQLAGTAIGAVAGGLIGNQIGHGRGNTLATVAGAVGGGYAGNRIQHNQQQKRTHIERRCWQE
jgi:uncharacterized protein YcfJ